MQAAPRTDGSTNFVGTTTLRLLISGDELCHVDTPAERGDAGSHVLLTLKQDADIIKRQR